MKEISLQDSIQRAAKFNKDCADRIIVPGQKRSTANWPMCLTCLKEVDAVAMQDAGPKGCEITAKCHGKEEAIKVRWTLSQMKVGDDILDDWNVGWAINRAMRDSLFFDPKNLHDFSSKRAS